MSSFNRRSGGSALLVACFTLTAFGETSWAQEREVSLRIGFDNEASMLRHPGDESASPGAWTYIPRLGLGFGYSIGRLNLGFGIEVALPTRYLAQDVDYMTRNFMLRHGTLCAEHMAVAFPLTASLTLLGGVDWGLGIRATVGPSFARWHDLALQASDYASLHVEQGPTWHPTAYARVGVFGVGQPTDWLAIILGPYASVDLDRNIGIGFVSQMALF